MGVSGGSGDGGDGRSLSLVGGQAFDQGIDACACCLQAQTQQIALLRKSGDLIGEQSVGALQFLVAHQQTLAEQLVLRLDQALESDTKLL